MDELIDKYVAKLHDQGLSSPQETLLGVLDAEIAWNRDHPAADQLEQVFAAIGVNSLLLARPKEPYRSIIEYLAREPGTAIRPHDSETRTFLHDIPVVRSPTAEAIIDGLRSRKCLIVPGSGIVAAGSVSPEQTFIHFSSVCFATFTTFFAQLLSEAGSGRIDSTAWSVYERAVSHLPQPPSAAEAATGLKRGPFCNEEEVVSAMDQAGKTVVRLGLVDSFFGNISYRLGRTIYISQTSSSLDELIGCIDPCPMDGSSSAAVTASSELSAHREILAHRDFQAVVHGHPKFAVILSMHCQTPDCQARGECHRRCPRHREVCSIPIVSGEVGTGPFGLYRTVPPAVLDRGGAIVYGHGVFTAGRDDFLDGLTRLVEIENLCRSEYFRCLMALQG